MDKAIPLVDNLIDRALIYGYPTLKIIHGIGSGTLRRVIRKYLKENFYVKDFTPGGEDGINDGFTIVKL